MSATNASSNRKNGLGICCAKWLVMVVAALVLQPSVSLAADPDAPFFSAPGWGLWQPVNAPHLVLRPHRQPSLEESTTGHPHGVGTEHRRHHPRGGHHRPEHVSGARTAVPEAATIYRKKVPYSYGYFGAQTHRHWSLHRGHQQDRIEWVLR